MDETEICETFAEAAEAAGWRPYPEVDGWDLVCVKIEPKTTRYGAEEGTQLAVEAKTRCRVKALEQCIKRLYLGPKYEGLRESSATLEGPDHAAIIAPTVGESFAWVARSLGLHTWEVDESFTRLGIKLSNHDQYEFDHFDDELWTPPVVPDVEAGGSSPSSLTEWRAQALKLCAILRSRGWLSTADFKRTGVNKTTWRDRWVESDGREPVEYEGETRRFGRYVPTGEELPDAGWEGEQLRIMAQNPDDVPDGDVNRIFGLR